MRGKKKKVKKGENAISSLQKGSSKSPRATRSINTKTNTMGTS